LDNIEQDNNLFASEKPYVTTLFDYRKYAITIYKKRNFKGIYNLSSK